MPWARRVFRLALAIEAGMIGWWHRARGAARELTCLARGCDWRLMRGDAHRRDRDCVWRPYEYCRRCGVTRP